MGLPINLNNLLNNRTVESNRFFPNIGELESRADAYSGLSIPNKKLRDPCSFSWLKPGRSRPS